MSRCDRPEDCACLPASESGQPVLTPDVPGVSVLSWSQSVLGGRRGEEHEPRGVLTQGRVSPVQVPLEGPGRCAVVPGGPRTGQVGPGNSSSGNLILTYLLFGGDWSRWRTVSLFYSRRRRDPDSNVSTRVSLVVPFFVCPVDVCL